MTAKWKLAAASAITLNAPVFRKKMQLNLENWEQRLFIAMTELRDAYTESS